LVEPGTERQAQTILEITRAKLNLVTSQDTIQNSSEPKSMAYRLERKRGGESEGEKRGREDTCAPGAQPRAQTKDEERCEKKRAAQVNPFDCDMYLEN
jgi:hypothetical protein